MTYKFKQELLEWGQQYPEIDINILYDYIKVVIEHNDDTPSPYNISLFAMGLEMADVVLACSDVHEDTLAVAIVFPTIYYNNFTFEQFGKLLTAPLAKAVAGVLQMDMVPIAASNQPRFRQSINNMRKLMLAMVDDFRIVLIKLAERLVVMQHLRELPEPARHPIALEVQRVYAPLANRMGVGYLKWQLEDLSFRYIEPDIYIKISRSLNQKRVEREEYIRQMIVECDRMLQNSQLKNVSISGRAKHIYSIHKKLLRKHSEDVSALFDTSALRILCDSVSDCYTVLGLVHERWQHVDAEFDDYITSPKANGYQSIHTAVIGLSDRCVEIQIRTYAMHDAAEGGVASHWSYKEDSGSEQSYQKKIDALRHLMRWQSSLTATGSSKDDAFQELFSDRAYVFTPDGDVVDLPAGATPLDFAYHIHTEVGNRCRGAKINGKLEPLTTRLHTGDKIEILSAKTAKPSRDWLDENKGYLKTARARSKVAHFFKHQDSVAYIVEGQAILDKLVRKYGFSKDDVARVRLSYNFATVEEFYIAIANGVIGSTTLLNRLRADAVVDKPNLVPLKHGKSSATKYSVIVDGLGATETLIAQCCRPIPGDPITGYVAQERGVVVHHRDCVNLLRSMQRAPERLLKVWWSDQSQQGFIADLLIDADDTTGVVADIMHVISADKINIRSINAVTKESLGVVRVHASLEVDNLEQLEHIIQKIQQMPAVHSVLRA